MKDLKNYGSDIQHSVLVTQARKVNKRTSWLVNTVGLLILAGSVYLSMVVLFEGAL